tara:strand:+ start:643 stop:1749 length:1107 start_codon:yes stop_codon:yes gene_type:complete
VDASPLLDLHRSAGARLVPPPSGDLLLTYGQVPEEYEAARNACAMFDATTLGAIEVRGADAEDFLHRLLSNRIKGLAVGCGNATLLLDGKGKVLHAMDLAREAQDRFRLTTRPGRSADLATALDMYLFAESVELEDLSAGLAPIELTGATARAVLGQVVTGDLPTNEHDFADLTFGDVPCRVTSLPVAGAPGFRVEAGAVYATALWTALVEAGARPSGLAVRDMLRVEAGRARWGDDVDDAVYPQEARWLDAFSLDKGCYIGQEVVAKIDTYGGLNKRLMALRVDVDEPVPRGTRLFKDQDGEWRDLGVVTSWAYSFTLDAGLVLAYVKRKHQELGTVFRLGEGPGTATLVPLPVRPESLVPADEVDA